VQGAGCVRSVTGLTISHNDVARVAELVTVEKPSTWGAATRVLYSGSAKLASMKPNKVPNDAFRGSPLLVSQTGIRSPGCRASTLDSRLIVVISFP
jgi:hypothetical protein